MNKIMIMGQAEITIKVISRDRAAVEGFARYLRENFQHAFPSPVRQGDRDDTFFCFVNLTIEGSESAKILGKVRI